MGGGFARARGATGDDDTEGGAEEEAPRGSASEPCGESGPHGAGRAELTGVEAADEYGLCDAGDRGES